MTKKTVRDDDLNELERLSAEVAQLREELDFERDCLAAAKRNGAALSAAYEATKAELAKTEALWEEERNVADASARAIEAAEARVAELTEKQYKAAALLIDEQQSAHASEARVAELERHKQKALLDRDDAISAGRAAVAALNQARGLLERGGDMAASHALECIVSALRAHPATARPDTATTGAEFQIVECTDTPRGRAKEQGT